MMHLRSVANWDFLLRHPILVHLLTDSKSLSTLYIKGVAQARERIMLDIYATRKAYKSQEISFIDPFRGSNNLRDGPAKPKVEEALKQLLKTAYHKPKVYL